MLMVIQSHSLNKIKHDVNWPTQAILGQSRPYAAGFGQRWPEVARSGQKWPEVARDGQVHGTTGLQ